MLPVAGTVCGLAWLAEVCQEPFTVVASSRTPKPVQDSVSDPAATVGRFNTGRGPLFTAWKVDNAFGLDESLSNTRVPSGRIENHARLAPPVEWPATRRKG